MTVPTAATKVNLDSGTDDPRQARAELADLVDKFNTLRGHLSSSGITSGSSVLGIGTGLESAAGTLRLSDSGVAAGSYSAASITVDAKGRVTAAADGAASQTEMEAAASNAVAATPANMHWHPGVAKAWLNYKATVTRTIRSSYNVSGVTSDGASRFTVSWGTDFSGANEYAVATSYGGTIDNGVSVGEESASRTAGSAQFRGVKGVNASDPDIMQIVAFGDFV